MPSSERVAYSPGEFAELFGKSQTWGYRQIYAGKVNAITKYGRLQIPASEVERILKSAGIYDGKPSKSKSVPDQKRTAEQENVWQRFLKMRLQHSAPAAPQNRIIRKALGPGANSKGKTRGMQLARLKQVWKGKGVSSGS